MEQSETPPFLSPKRKRDSTSHYTADCSPSSIRLRTDLPPRPLEKALKDCDSPRTLVTGQLQALRLQHENVIPVVLRPLPESMPMKSIPGVVELHTLNCNVESSPSDTLNPTRPNVNPLSTPPAIPSTPHLRPISPSPSRTISPLPQPRYRSPPPPSSPSSPPVEFLGSANTKSVIGASRSPSPTDALDIDNLGINGIGFRPTPAMAYARAQRRKQQVAEWKSREAKEARQRRSEMRRKREEGLIKEMLTDGESVSAMGRAIRSERDSGVRRVRFLE